MCSLCLLWFNGHFPVQRTEAHQVDRRLENRYPILFWAARQTEPHIFIASGHVALEPFAVQVIGAAFAGKDRLAACAALAGRAGMCTAGESLACPFQASR